MTYSSLANSRHRAAGAAIIGIAAVMLAGLVPNQATAGDRRARPAPAQTQQQRHHRQPRYESKRVETQRTDDGYRRSTTWQDSQGRSATREATVQRDPDAGTRSRDVVYTGPEGRTRSVSHDAQRTEDGYTRHSTYTDAQGRTATRDAVVTRDPEAGTRNRQVTYTGRDGQERHVSDSSERTDDGYTRSTVYTNAQGESVTRNASGSWDPETKTWVREVEFENDREDEAGGD